MRKILTQEEIAKRDKRRNRVMAIFILAIMILSSVGFAFIYNAEDNQQIQAGAQGVVQNLGGRYYATWGGQEFSFATSPESALNATNMSFIPGISKYVGKPLYVDVEGDIIYSEIAFNLEKYAERVNRACFDNCENSSYVEKNCSDNLIIYRQSLDNLVYQNESCTFIEGDIRAVDAFLYKEIGIA